MNTALVLEDLPGRGAARGTIGEAQRTVWRMVAFGGTTRQIARARHVQYDTVKNQITDLFMKTGARNRVELAILAVQYGVITREDIAAIAERAQGARAQEIRISR